LQDIFLRLENNELQRAFNNSFKLKLLSKDCTFQMVSAEQYREELIRDSFINGLNSQGIRQRLLEKDHLSLEAAYD